MDNHIEETLKEGMKRRTESARLSEDMLTSAASRYGRMHTKSRRRKVVLRIGLAAAAIVVVAAGTVAAIPSARAAAEAFFGFDSKSVDTQFGYLPDQSHWSKTYYILIPPQSALKGGNECLGQSLYQNGAQFVHYKLSTDTGKPLPSGTTLEIKNHGDAVLQTGLSGALLTTSDDVANESFFGRAPKDTSFHPGARGNGAGAISGNSTQQYSLAWTCDKKTGSVISGTWSYSLVPIIHTANGGSSTDNSPAVHVSSGTWSYDTSTEKTNYAITDGKINPFTTGVADFKKAVLNMALEMSGGTAPTVPYHDASSLTWVSNNIRVEILSNLSKEELIKVAEGFSIGRQFPDLNASAITTTTTTSLDPASSAAADAVAKRVAASLVTVKPSGNQYVPQIGVVYSADGLILTQTTGDRASLKVTLSNGETVTAKLVGKDKDTGLELIRVKKSGLSPVKLASGKPAVGEWIALVSNTGSSLTSVPGSVIASESEPASIPSEFFGLIHVRPDKSLNAQFGAFDKQGYCVGFVTMFGGGDGSDFLCVRAADEVAAAVARILSGS